MHSTLSKLRIFYHQRYLSFSRRPLLIRYPHGSSFKNYGIYLINQDKSANFKIFIVFHVLYTNRIVNSVKYGAFV